MTSSCNVKPLPSPKDRCTLVTCNGSWRQGIKSKFPAQFMSHCYGILFIEYHYNDVIMVAIASKITSLTIVYSTVHSDADQRKHQSSASLAFLWGIHRGPLNSPHKRSVLRKMFPFDDVIMIFESPYLSHRYGQISPYCVESLQNF